MHNIYEMKTFGYTTVNKKKEMHKGCITVDFRDVTAVEYIHGKGYCRIRLDGIWVNVICDYSALRGRMKDARGVSNI